MSKTSKGIIYQYEDGGTYCGEWEKDAAHGYGCGTGPKGRGRFEGSWHRGNQVSGVYIWPQGMKYMGQWKDNQRDGLGRETREDGSEYCGEFTRGARGTYGVIKLVNGTYKGSWRNGKQDGEGEEVYVDGGCYRGQYKGGLRCGFGTRTSAAYESSNKDSAGKSQDQIKAKSRTSIVSANSKKTSITSTISMPAGVSGASGEGGNSSTSISSNISNPEQMAQIYEGEWKNDKRHGYGAIKCMGSYTYYGQWENNSRTGYGVLAHENGTKEEGQWQSGQLIVALKRRKINLKSHQLESKVQGAYTQAVQAADAARNKALLAESRATSAMAKSKMAQVVAMRAERDASMAREKAEEYKNAPRISEKVKSPIEDPNTSPTHFFRSREPSSDGNINNVSYLNVSQDPISHSPSFDCIQTATDFPRPHSAPLGGSDSSGSDSELPLSNSVDSRVRQSSGRSTAASMRSSLDCNSLRRNHAPHFFVMDSIDRDSSSCSSMSRRSSDGTMKGRKLYALRMDSEMLKEEANMEEGVDGEWLEGWGRRRLDTARRRKRDKTTGELEQSSDEDTAEERAKIKAAGLDSKLEKPPLESKHSMAMEMLVNNLNQMANWNKMIAYVNFFLLIFLMILILVVVGSMYYYQLLSYYHNHQDTETHGPANFISPIA